MKEFFKCIEKMPLTLSAEHIAKALGLSKATAYNLLNSNGFPVLKIGKRKVVPKDEFIIWVNNHTKLT